MRYLRMRVVLRKLLIAGVAAALAVPAASADRRQTPPSQTVSRSGTGKAGTSAPGPAPSSLLMPGVTLQSAVEFTTHGPVALRVVRAPRPGGLWQVAPTLSNEAILGRETLTAMQRRLAPQATMVSVDGDLFAAGDGHPTGIVLRNGVLDHAPVQTRSSAGFDAQGALHVDRVFFVGYWRGTGQRQPLEGVNQTTDPGDVVLFTPSWGPATPRAADTVDAVLSPFPAAAPNTDLPATVTQVTQGGGTPIPPGGAVLQARGPAIAAILTRDAPVGTPVTTRLIFQPAWSGVAQAIGGGPILVRNGKAVFRSGEAFSPDQLLPRSARTAVGQTADGTVLLVQVDGGQPGYSVGMTNFELALTLQRLGAVRAMALGSGTASGLAFDGALLSQPQGAEQPVADALSILYYGVYLPPPATGVFSPNGDGAGDTEELAYKIVRPSTVHAVLVGPDGVARAVDDGHRDPGTYRFPFTGADAAGAPLPEGAWRWHVDATDDSGAASSAEQRFSYDLTLGSLQAAGATLTAQLSRPADVTVTIASQVGTVVRTIQLPGRPAGQLRVTWDGLADSGRKAAAGRYVATVSAKSAVGTSALQTTLGVRP